MKVGKVGEILRKASALMIIVGGGLAAYGFSGFSGDISSIMGNLRGGSGWDDVSRIQITAGVVLFIVGVLFRKQPRSS